MQLKDIAQVKAGYTFRGAIESDTHGDVFVLQAKDLNQGQSVVQTNSLARISADTVRNPYTLQKNDILIIARGMKSGSFRSAVYVSEAKNVIASSSLHIIRLRDSNVSPEYVSLYLNSKEGQDMLSQFVSGSYIGLLPRAALENIRIPIPSREKQDIVVQLYRNAEAQKKITNRRNELNEHILHAVFERLTTV